MPFAPTHSIEYFRRTSCERPRSSSHPGAYLRAGLRDVAEQEPECLPVIAPIPREQFNPTNPNFAATFNQVVEVVRQPGVSAWLSSVMLGSAYLAPLK